MHKAVHALCCHKINTGFGAGLLHLGHIAIVQEEWVIMQYLEQVYYHLHISITLSRNRVVLLNEHIYKILYTASILGPQM